MSIGVCYPDRYAVEETFQLLKVPWEWYEPGHTYDVVIARRFDLPGFSGNLIDLAKNDFFQKISSLLNKGEEHLHEPVCDILADQLRQELRNYTLLVEIPPAPWGHPYLVSLTHDVDVTSIRECRVLTVGYAAYQCLRQGNLRAGLHLLSARLGLGSDPWVLFERWKTLEREMGVRSTFFFVPKKEDPGIRAHPYRAVGYTPDRDTLEDLAGSGWEVGVHGIDNWTDAGAGRSEQKAIGPSASGTRVHWLLFEPGSWKVLDEAGYSYDSTFGYNDDAGFRAGTLQAYRPRDTEKILELPLHIQDLGLFGNFCWAPVGSGWEKTPCLHLTPEDARVHCDHIFDYAQKYGGTVTLLWHYENLVPPRDWSGLYQDLVNRAKTDGAWLTTAGNVVAWFRARRALGATCTGEGNVIHLDLNGDLPPPGIPPCRLRLYISPDRIHSIDTEFIAGPGYIDILPSGSRVTVHTA